MIKLKEYKSLIKTGSLILLIILGFLVYIKFETIKEIVNIILIAFIFAYALKPIRNGVSERLNINKRVSSISIILVIGCIIIGALYITIPSILSESINLGEMLDNLDSYMISLAENLEIKDMGILNNVYEILNEELNEYLVNFSNNFLENIINIFTNIISCAIIPVVTYYFLVDGDLIYHKLLLILPTQKRIVAKKLLCNIDKVLSRYIISQFLLCLIIGILTYIILKFIDIKFALILGIFNGILNIVPYFGPVIGGIPAVFIALLDSPSKVVAVVIGIFIIQQIEGNILSPKVTGNCTDMHPIVIVILLLIGEKLGGFIGMVLAVPIGVIVKVIYDDINDYFF